MFSLEFFQEFFQASKMCFKYENVTYVEFEIQRRVLTQNVDKRPSTVNIYIYSGYIVHIRVSKGRDVPRDVPGQSGTGRPVVPLSRDKKNSLSRCPFVPGQEKFPCPAVPLSRDKSSSKNPGTRSSVPGRPAGQNHLLFFPLMLFSE